MKEEGQFLTIQYLTVLNELFAARSQGGYMRHEFIDGKLIRSDAVKALQMADTE